MKRQNFYVIMFCLLGKMNQFVYINFLCIAWIYRYYFNLITCDA